MQIKRLCEIYNNNHSKKISAETYSNLQWLSVTYSKTPTQKDLTYRSRIEREDRIIIGYYHIIIDNILQEQGVQAISGSRECPAGFNPASKSDESIKNNFGQKQAEIDKKI